MSKDVLRQLRRALFDCLSHFRTLDNLARVLRLHWNHPDPSCLNTATINHLASTLGRGEVFRTEEAPDNVRILWINHPAVDAPAMFSIELPERFPFSISEPARQVAEANLSAWLELTAEQPAVPSIAGKAGKGKALRDKATESRDKWVYDQCCKRTPHDRILAELKKLAPKRKWRTVSSKQRIQQIGNEYADRHSLERPPPRQNL